jgi:hypothetical protein
VDAPVNAASPRARGRASLPSSLSTHRNRQGAAKGVLRERTRRGWIDSGVIPTRVIERTPTQAPSPLTPREVRWRQLASRQSPADTLLFG